MRKSLISITSIVILGGIFLLINGIGRHLLSRSYIDVTEEGLYSLSSGTKNILKNLNSNIVLRFYFSSTNSSKIPPFKLYGERVLDLLKEYKREGGDKIRLEVYNPMPDSTEAEWAEKYGVKPLPTRDGEVLFLGLVVSNEDGNEDVISFFDIGKERFLEYDITKVIYKINQVKKPKIGIISSFSIPEDLTKNSFSNSTYSPFLFVSQLKQFADVKILKGDISYIPDDVDLLLVVFAKNLSEETLYAIDQYLMHSKNLIILEDPYNSSYVPTEEDKKSKGRRASDLNFLTKAWAGVWMMENQAVSDILLAFRTIQTIDSKKLEAFVLWLNLRKKENFNQKDVITSNIKEMILPWVGALEFEKRDGIKVEPLLLSSDIAQMVPESYYKISGGEPQKLLTSYTNGEKRQILAARVSGKFKSAFLDSPSKEEANMSKINKHISESKKQSNIIIVSDSDFILNRFSLSLSNVLGENVITLRNANLVFLLNAVENLLGSDDLISVRSRGRFRRPFHRVKDLERIAERRWRQEEITFQAKVYTATKRLQVLERTAKKLGVNVNKQLLDTKVLEEVTKLKEEKREAQKKLREVRRKLREDKEKLGEVLFFINTFLVPLLIILISVIYVLIKSKKNRKD